MIPKVARVLDLTQPTYHNSPSLTAPLPPQIVLIRNGSEHGWNLEQLIMTTHQGTHMDAPYHLEGYERTIDQFAPEDFQGEGVIVDLRHKKPSEPISPADLEIYSSSISPNQIVLLNTGWGKKRSWTQEWAKNSPWLSPSAAWWLVERNVKGVGIDHFSIGGMVDENETTHRTLLKANIWILEDLSLPDELFDENSWHIIALPLLLRDCSGAPCRAIAIHYQ